jgi:hypothetical protein
MPHAVTAEDSPSAEQYANDDHRRQDIANAVLSRSHPKRPVYLLIITSRNATSSIVFL